MKQFIVLIAIQLCLCVCIVGAEKKSCPAGFEKVEGMNKSKCFHEHIAGEDWNPDAHRFNFTDALKICTGKNATVFEPKSRKDGETIFKFVRLNIWINYHDMIPRNMVSLVGVKDSVLLAMTYMGSLSTFDKMPIEWWNNIATANKGGKRRITRGYHCAVWYVEGVMDIPCDAPNGLVCETDAL